MGQSAPTPVPPVALPVSGAPVEEKVDLILRLAEGGEATEVRTTQTLPTSEFWIGIALGELPEVAKQQLGLEQGLVVAEVMANSPAAKAEFKANDILIKAGDAKLAAAADLIKAVDAAQEKELAIVVVRGGKERTIKVTPIKRSKASSEAERLELLMSQAPNAELKVHIKKLEDALTQLKDKAGGGPLGIMLARPGVVPPTIAGAHVDVLKPVELPKNLKINITKQGDQPTKIHVEKDGKEWDVTEEKLGDLPEDVRTHVQQFLGHRTTFRLKAAVPAVPGVPGLPGQGHGLYEYRGLPLIPPMPPAAPGAPAPPAPPTTARTAVRAYIPNAVATPAVPVAPHVAQLHTYRVETASGGVESKLDAILSKLDQLQSKSVEQLEKDVKQLRKELDELRGKSPGERKE